MHNSADAVALAERIERGRYGSAELEAIMGVSQATVSRLRNGRIARVSRYLAALKRHEVERDRDRSLEECLSALGRRAEVDPVLRDVILDLGRLMRNA